MKLSHFLLAALLLACFLLWPKASADTSKSDAAAAGIHAELTEYSRKAEALSKFFDHYKCPQINYDLIGDYINAADKYGLPYNLLPAISLAESSCAKRYPASTRNIFGWNSARYTFASIPESIDFISERLARGRYYAGKSIADKLHAYCPNPAYPKRVMGIMKEIEQ